jgi:hypothetical protein
MLGLSIDSWNLALVGGLALGALSAAIVVVATIAVIRLQNAESAATKQEFDRYKLEAAQKIAEADARALEAQAQLEKFKSPRNIVNQSAVVSKLIGFKGTRFDMAVVVGDPEANRFLGQLSKTLQLAGWEWIDFGAPRGPLTFTYTWPGLPNVGQMGGFGVDIFVHPEHMAEFSAPADLLSSILSEEGLSISKPASAVAAQGFSNDNAIHIVIGKKPL